MAARKVSQSSEIAADDQIGVEEAGPADAAPPTVPMKRNAEQWPAGPHTADVHVDEVDNWKKHGWEHAD